MTLLRVSGVFLLVIWATSSSIGFGVQGQEVVLPNGPLSEGQALELFFNATLPGSGFTKNKTCDWNTSRVSCDSQHGTVRLLTLARMGLSGPIPSGTISNLTGLLRFDASDNDLNGSLPDISQLGNLTDFILSGNNFSGALSNSVFPTGLVYLDLSMNSLVGTIPESVYNISSLSHLQLGSNKLSGPVNFTALTNMPLLVVLDLSSNNLTGNLSSISSHSNLLTLDLHENQFEGNVGALVDSLYAQGSLSLTVLDLSSNNFVGFPLDLSHLVNLSMVGLGGNKFSSHLFPTLPTADLMDLNLSSTSLYGSIPDSVSDLSLLARLDLSTNNLTGSIPKHLGELRKLERLDLSKNRLSGEFPSNLNELTFLSFLNVSYNNLSGSIPVGNQFSTFDDTSYEGNTLLCGAVVSRACTTSSSLTESPSGKGKSTNVGAIVAGVVSGVVLLAIVVVGLCIWCRVSRAVKPLAKDEPRHVSGPMQYEKDAETWATGVKDPNGITVVMFERPLLNLTFTDLLQATGNFSKEMQLADGGYGPVYKGVLQDGTQLAIKVLVEVGFSDGKKAAARIEGLAKVKHANLVSLIGYCLVGEDSILIYDYMVNGDLQRWLHELPEGTRNPEDWSRDTWEQMEGGVELSGEYLSWPTRHKMALGIARALAFLHHGCSPHVIHRDVKTSNILLDENFDAHLVDSGLAGISRVNGTPIIGGTLGYVPPEYGQTWQATTRGDVYSFGVVLLELVTGRKPTGHYFHDSYGGNLVGWVRAMIKQDKRGQKSLDPKLVSLGHVPEMLEVLRIGYLCTAETPAKRPTMQQVLGLLKDCQSGVIS